MKQKYDECLEYFVERFTYSIKRSKLHDLELDTLKSLLLKVIRDERINLLNLMRKRDVSQFPFQDICELCKNISRGKTKYGRYPQDPIMERVSKLALGLVTQTKINNLLDILGSLNEQMNML